jgi:hypothetical protein
MVADTCFLVTFGVVVGVVLGVFVVVGIVGMMFVGRVLGNVEANLFLPCCRRNRNNRSAELDFRSLRLRDVDNPIQALQFASQLRFNA